MLTKRTDQNQGFGEDGIFTGWNFYYGFKQTADVRRALELCVQEGWILIKKCLFFHRQRTSIFS